MNRQQNFEIKSTFHNVVQKLVKPFLSVSLLMSAAVVGQSFSGVAANAIAQPSSQSSTNLTTLPDGVYLYGQSAQPNQIGKGYFVFEVSQGKVAGALYMPRSSFDCAAGQFEVDQLSLTVVNSYDRSTNPFEIALERTSNIAGANPTKPALSLEGFQRLQNVSKNDLRMLETCKTDLKQLSLN